MLNARIVFEEGRRFNRLWNYTEYKVDRTFREEYLEYNHNEIRGWAESLSADPAFLRGFDGKVIKPNVCGKDASLPGAVRCIAAALPIYGRCVEELTADRGHYFAGDTLASLPAFYALFRRPAPRLARRLAGVRERLGLPPAPAEEPRPGAWGLRAPGHYMLAFHFRAVPLGFEPLSVRLGCAQMSV